MHWRTPAFLIWASALTPLSRRFIRDFMSITLQHGSSSRAVVVMVTIAVLPCDSGLQMFSPGYACFMPADFPRTMTLLWSGGM